LSSLILHDEGFDLAIEYSANITNDQPKRLIILVISRTRVLSGDRCEQVIQLNYCTFDESTVIKLDFAEFTMSFVRTSQHFKETSEVSLCIETFSHSAHTVRRPTRTKGNLPAKNSCAIRRPARAEEIIFDRNFRIGQERADKAWSGSRYTN
jgi:hypothetical protein